jgi:phage terminase small subunit
VAKAVEEGRKKLAEKAMVSAQEVVQTYSKIARYDARKLFTPDGQLKAIHELDDDTAACIASIEVITQTVKRKRGKPQPAVISRIHKIKVWDKTVALQALGRIHALFRDKVEVNATLTLESLVLGAMKRGEQLEAPAPKPTEAPLTIEGKAEEPA